MHGNLILVGKLRLFFIVAVCLASFFLLQACGGGKQSSYAERRSSPPDRSSPTASAPAPAEDQRPLIVTFGDSLTGVLADRSFSDNLQDLLDPPGLRYRIDNQGVSGDTSTDGLARIDNVIGEKPALVILEFGGNDGLRGIPVEATRQNLEQMIERLKTARIPVVLLGITLPPNYGPEYVKPFTAMFPEVAKQYGLRFMPFLLLHVYRNPSLMQPDGIHPNGAGNRIVAEDVFKLIRPILQGTSKKAGTN